MRFVISRTSNGNAKSASAGNQKRSVTGISGQVYDISYMAVMSESADAGLGDSQCSLSLSNLVARTANNVDDRSAAEKMFSIGQSSNFKFSVYFTKEKQKEAIEANRHIDRRLQYELSKIRSMAEGEYSKSISEMAKMSAIREAKRRLGEMGFPSLTQAEWENALTQLKMKPRQVGINTFELSLRASTRDQSLKNEGSNAWGETEAGYEAGTFNAAGTKTLPLFTPEQVEEAKKVSEKIYTEFKPMYDQALIAPADYESMFVKFCEVAKDIDKDVPKGFKVNYLMWTPEQQDRISKDASDLVKLIMGV